MPEIATENQQFEESLAQLEQLLREGVETAPALMTAARGQYARQLTHVSPIVASALSPSIPGGVDSSALLAARLAFELNPDQPFAGLGPLFQWGMEFSLCLLSPFRVWLQPLVQRSETGLEPGARELRMHGLKAFQEGRWQDALKYLSSFTQIREDDGLIWRMIAFSVLRLQKWDQARSAYAVAARLTDKAFPIFAAECHTAACFAARQQEEWELAQQHAAQAMQLAADMSVAQYEMGVAGVRMALTQQLLVPHMAHQTMMEATGALRKVLRQDCRYVVRLEMDPALAPVHDQVQILLQELHSDLAREASGALAAIRTAIVNAEYDCTAERFGAIAARQVEAGKLLADVYARNSILDFDDVIRRGPDVQKALLAIRGMIRRIDDRMQEIMQSYNVARQVVAANEWAQVGGAMEEKLKHLRQLHSNRDLESYQTLELEIPEARTAFYNFAAQRLRILRTNITQSLAVARSVSQKLNQKASTNESRAAKPPFRMEGGFIYWLAGFFILRSGLPQTINIPPTVLTVIAAMVSAAAILFLHRFMARQRILQSHAARREAAIHDREIYQPLCSLISQIDQCTELCNRERPFSVPTNARTYIGDSKPGRR